MAFVPSSLTRNPENGIPLLLQAAGQPENPGLGSSSSWNVLETHVCFQFSVVSVVLSILLGTQ